MPLELLQQRVDNAVVPDGGVFPAVRVQLCHVPQVSRAGR